MCVCVCECVCDDDDNDDDDDDDDGDDKARQRNQSHYELMENVTEMTDSHRPKQTAHCGIIIWPF